MLITVARAIMVTSDDSVAGKPFWEKNELLPCWIVERFLVGNAHIKNTTKLPTFSANKSSSRLKRQQVKKKKKKKKKKKNKSRIFFSLRILITAHVNIEMMFSGKLNRGGHDQNARIYFIYKFAIVYKRA